MLLEASGSSNSQSRVKGKCHHCNQPGHFRRDCPQLKARNQNGGGNRDNRGGGGGSGNSNGGSSRGSNWNRNEGGRGQDGQRSWRTTPPAPGAPTFTTRNGKRFDWCQKCKRYTTTHTTNTHTGRPAQSSTPPTSSDPTAALSLLPDPSAWVCTNTITFTDVLSCFAPFLRKLLSFMQIMVGFAMIFPGVAWLSHECPWTWVDVFDTFHQNPWSLLAPIFWAVILLMPSLLHFEAF